MTITTHFTDPTAEKDSSKLFLYVKILNLVNFKLIYFYAPKYMNHLLRYDSKRLVVINLV